MEKKKTLNPLLATTGNGKTLADNMMEVTGSPPPTPARCASSPKPVGQEGENRTDTPEPASPGSTSEKCGKLRERIKKYTRLKEQGSALWIAPPVMQQLKQICHDAKPNVPIRGLGSAIITAYIEEHKDELDALKDME
jgi:hypothetical protein